MLRKKFNCKIVFSISFEVQKEKLRSKSEPYSPKWRAELGMQKVMLVVYFDHRNRSKPRTSIQ